MRANDTSGVMKVGDTHPDEPYAPDDIESNYTTAQVDDGIASFSVRTTSTKEKLFRKRLRNLF